MRHNLSYIESFAEVVEEEKHEDDYYHQSLRRRNGARFKLLKDKNEFNKKSHKRNRSTDFTRPDYNNDIGDVSEDDEEEISDSSLEKQKTD